MDTAPTDDELLEAFRSGDNNALSAILERHAPAVLRFGGKMCRDDNDAQDVLQETLLAAARTLAGFRGGSSLKTWLFTIARSFCIKARRTSKFAPTSTVSLDATNGGSDRDLAERIATTEQPPDEALANHQLGAALEEAIGALEPMYREVLILRDVEGLSASEVAEVLGIGVEAVKSRLHRARVSVRNHLTPLLREPEAPATPGCVDVVTLFSRYLEGEIGPEECRAMEQHVESCPRCSTACDSLKRSIRMCRASSGAVVSPDVQKAVRDAIRAVVLLPNDTAPASVR